MVLLNDFWALACAIYHGWMGLVSGTVGVAIMLLERYRHRSLKWRAYTTIVILCLLPPFFMAWHDLKGAVRKLEAEKRQLSSELAAAHAVHPVRVNSDNLTTKEIASPIVTGSGNTITYGTRPSGEPVQRPRKGTR